METYHSLEQHDPRVRSDDDAVQRCGVVAGRELIYSAVQVHRREPPGRQGCR